MKRKDDIDMMKPHFQKDYKAMQNRAADELTRMLCEEIAQKIDKEILEQLREQNYQKKIEKYDYEKCSNELLHSIGCGERTYGVVKFTNC